MKKESSSTANILVYRFCDLITEKKNSNKTRLKYEYSINVFIMSFKGKKVEGDYRRKY